MPISPPSIDALPTPPDPDDRTTFNSRAYPWGAALQPFGEQLGAVAANVHGNAIEVSEAATVVVTAKDATVAASAAAVAAKDATVAASAATLDAAETVALQAAQVAEDAAAVAAGLAAIEGGPVASVNGRTGPAVVLTAADVGAQPTLVSGVNIKKINGQDLTGSGDLVLGGIASVNAYAGSANQVLAAASAGYQSIAMAAMGKHVTLPDATTMTVGGPRFVVKNDGGYPFGIRDSACTLIAAVAAGGIAYLMLKDNAGPAGAWSVVGDNLEPGLITLDATFGSTYAANVLAPFAALDANTSIHFAAMASGFAAFVVDDAGKVVSTPVTVSATASSLPKAVFKVSATSAIVFFGASASDHKAVVLTLTGASPSLSLSVGTAQSLTATMESAWAGENFFSAPKLAQLSSTLYLASYVDGVVVKAVAIGVSGATVTVGASASIVGSGGASASTTTYALTATTGLVLYKTSSSPYANNAVVISVSGTACTVNTPVSLALPSTDSPPPSSVLLSATKCIVVDNNYDGAGCYAVALTITGTAIAAGGMSSVESGPAGIGTNQYTSSSATRNNPHLWAIGANTAGLWYFDSSGVSRAVILTESGGTVTAGAKLYRSISGAGSGASGFGAVLPQGDSEFCAIIQRLAGTAGYANALSTCKISGTTITTGASVPLPAFGANPGAVHATRMASGKYVIHGVTDGWNNAVGFPVFSSNGDAIAYHGEVKAPMMNDGGGSWPRAVSSSRLVVLGNTYPGGAGGVASYQLRLLNLELCQ